MNKKNLIRVAIPGIAILLLTSCGKEPQAEIDAANTAIENARVAGAGTYYPEDFKALQDSMTTTTRLIQEEKAKVFATYSTAKTNLSNIKVYAVEIETNTLTRKEELTSEIQQTLDEIKKMIAEGNQLMTGIPKGKETTPEVVNLKKELNTLETSITEATAMIGKGEPMATLTQVKATKEKAASLNTNLKQVVESYKTTSSKGKKS